MKRKNQKLKHIKRDNGYTYERHVERKFGITEAQLNALLEKQGGCCAICGNTEPVINKGGVQKLSVDHCHATGKIRGLLCSVCNHLLGQAKDNVKVLRAAAVYLETADTGLRTIAESRFTEEDFLILEELYNGDGAK